MSRNYLFIFWVVAIAVVAQTLLKTGVSQIGIITNLSFPTFFHTFLKMVTNPFIITGLSLYLLSTFFWLILLSRLDLSFLYPFGALQYILIYISAFFFLNESINLGKIVGLSLILIGIFIINHSQ